MFFFVGGRLNNHLNAKVAKIFLNQIGGVRSERYHKSLTSMIEISVKIGLCPKN